MRFTGLTIEEIRTMVSSLKNLIYAGTPLSLVS